MSARSTRVQIYTNEALRATTIRPRPDVALLQACLIIAAETRDILYGINVWHLPDSLNDPRSSPFDSKVAQPFFRHIKLKFNVHSAYSKENVDSFLKPIPDIHHETLGQPWGESTEALHTYCIYDVENIWIIIDMLVHLELETLEPDVTGGYCPSGCCPRVPWLFWFLGQSTLIPKPKTVIISEASYKGEERKSIRRSLHSHNS